jgi:hypothetical protein
METHEDPVTDPERASKRSMSIFSHETEMNLSGAIAEYGFAMSCLVHQRLEQDGRIEEVSGLLAQGFQLLFTFSPELGSDGRCGQVGAAAFNPETRETVPLLRLELVEQVSSTNPPETSH